MDRKTASDGGLTPVDYIVPHEQPIAVGEQETLYHDVKEWAAIRMPALIPCWSGFWLRSPTMSYPTRA